MSNRTGRVFTPIRQKGIRNQQHPPLLDEPADETPFDPDFEEEKMTKQNRIATLRAKVSHPAYGFTTRQLAVVEELFAEIDSE